MLDEVILVHSCLHVFLFTSFPDEADISFPPTYRYERGSRDTYVWQKFKHTGVRVLPHKEGALPFLGAESHRELSHNVISQGDGRGQREQAEL